MKTVYKGFTLIDGNGDTPVENAYMVVEDKKITSVGPASAYKEDGDAEVVDLTGKTVMPGLINSHVHVTMEPVGDSAVLKVREPEVMPILRGAANLMKHLRAGTTFVRDLGAPKHYDIALRNAVNMGLVDGAQFITAGRCVTMTGGHGWSSGREADGPDEVRKAAREQLRAGADVVKIMATGGVMTDGVEPGSPQLGYEEIKAAVEEAHKAGKKTATHAQGTTGIKNAVRAGIDSVEHGIFLDDEVIQEMVERGTWLVPTLAAPHFIVVNGVEGGIPKYAVDKANYVMEYHKESFRNAHKAGVKIAMGTDSGTPFNPHGGAPHELKLMAENGMTPMETIVVSTRNSADLLGILDNYGTLEEGKFADFLVLDENPIDNLDTLFDINTVYKLGKKVI